MAEITENAQDVEMFLAQHGHRYTKIRFTFTIESVTLSLLTSAQGTVSVTVALNGYFLEGEEGSRFVKRKML